MKNLLLITFALSCSVYSISQTLPSPRSISIYHTNCLTTIDGLRSDEIWTQAEEHVFPYNTDNKVVPLSDIYAQIQLAWNYELGIFAFVHIEDDIDWFLDVDWYELDESELEQYLEGPWHRDNVEFFFYWGLEGEWGPEQTASSTNDSVWSQIRFNVCHAEEELETCLTVYTPGIADDEYALGTPHPNSEIAFIDAVALSTPAGWDLEVHFPFDIFVKRTDLDREENIYFGFECNINDAESEIFHKNHLFLLNDQGLDATWTDKRFLNTAILVSPDSVNMECELTSTTCSEKEPLTLFTSVQNGILAIQKIDELKIYDLAGTLLIHKQNLEPGQYFFELNPGIYIVSVNNAFGKKIMIE